jgi:hypothetical protein
MKKHRLMRGAPRSRTTMWEATIYLIPLGPLTRWFTSKRAAEDWLNRRSSSFHSHTVLRKVVS